MKNQPDQDAAEHGRSKPASGADEDTAVSSDADTQPEEIGGRKGPDPTRYGDWEKNGRCIDF